MSVSLNGFDEQVVTFEAAQGVKAGDLVCMSANKKVEACGENDTFCGVAIAVRNGYASVQIGGYITVKCDNTVSVGYQELISDENGKVTVLPANSEAVPRFILVVDVDSTAGTAGIIL